MTEVILRESKDHYILIVFHPSGDFYAGDTSYSKEWVIERLKEFGKDTTLLERYLEHGEVRNFGAYDRDYFLRLFIVPKVPYKVKSRKEG